LGNNYLVLGDHVYYGGKLLKQANGKKFTLISEEEFKKRNITRHYADGKLDPIAPYVYQIVGYDGQFYFAFGETIEPVN
jgi:hypothetical protein